MAKVVGIDLGTTNSVVAAIEGGQPSVIINAEGLRTTPSIVAYTKKQELLVGQIAKRQAVINPENTFFSVKRFIGSKENEISEDSKQLPYKVGKDQNDNIKIKCPALNKDFSPEEISAQVLRKLINDATSYLGQEVTVKLLLQYQLISMILKDKQLWMLEKLLVLKFYELLMNRQQHH
jgi:molecular chaperone DnaK (HSP70)